MKKTKLMTRIIVLILAIVLLLSVADFAFVSIANMRYASSKRAEAKTTAVEPEKKKEIINWSMSDEAKEMYKYLETNGGKEALAEGIFEEWIGTYNGRGEQVLPEVEVRNTVDSFKCNGENVYTLTSASGDDYDKIVLYIHGGAYVCEIDESHILMCDDLVDAMNAKVYMPLYPLAPDNSWEKSYEMMDELWPIIVKEGKPIYIMGDSAGGGYTLAFTEYLKANNETMPNKIVVFSPWVDVTMENPDIAACDEVDLTTTTYGSVECGKLWAKDTDRKDYRISPLYGDLSGLPDILMFVGTDEIVYPDDMKFYEQLTDTNATAVVADKFWHVFPLYHDIPERDKAIEMIAEFCQE